MKSERRQSAQPPALADKLIKWFCAEDLQETVLGDLHEEFDYLLSQVGARKARRTYWLEVLGFIKPRFIRRKKMEFSFTQFSTDMITSYFKVAWRNLLNNKGYSAINIFGLTLGFVVGILILFWVRNELGYDRFHPDQKNIYRVLSNMGKGEDRKIWVHSHAPIATFAKSEIPEVRNAVRIKENADFSVFKYQEKQFKEEKMGYADPSFFSVFGFKILKGSPRSPFNGDHSIAMTESTAKRYFNDQDPIGKVLRADGKENFVVSCVLEDFPDNSSVQFDMLFPMALYARLYSAGRSGAVIDQDWGNFTFTTYLQLNPAASPKTVAAKMARTLVKNFRDIGMSDPYSLQPIAESHLYQPDGSEGMIQIVRIFLYVGILILFIACINYVNLSTARAVIRIKEVGVRKMIGAGRFQLFMQFVLETTLIFLLASFIAVLLVPLLMPAYNLIAGKNLKFSVFDPDVWVLVGGTVGLALVLSSIYPAFLLSSFEPLKASKVSTGNSSSAFRKILVTVQFTFSVALICGTIVIDRQLAYISKKQLGYEKEQTFTFSLRNMESHIESVKTELLRQQGVSGVTSASDIILNMQVTTTETDWDGKSRDEKFFIHPLDVDKDFLSVFRLRLTEGQGFQGVASDSAHYILNETAVKEAGIRDPVGKRFRLFGSEGIIIGVVKDFHFASLRQKIEPAVLQYRPGNYEMYVKTTGKDAALAIAGVEKLWKQYNADADFEYAFLDQTYDNLYRSEQRTGTLFKFFSLVAITISCLGLFGLATYLAHVKTKEVGIRKVMGASIAGIVKLLVKDFMVSVTIAIIIAVPLAWYGLNKWLQEYAYRIDMQWWMFTLAGLLAVAIALVTVGFQSIRAALMNPVKSLRSE